MTQIYATTTNFLGQDYALLVADRRKTVTSTIGGITALRVGQDKIYDEVNKIKCLDNIAYAFAGQKTPEALEYLIEKPAKGTWDEALQVVQTHFGRLSKNVGKPYYVVVAGYDQTPKIISFVVEPQGITTYNPLEYIVSAIEPSESAEIFIEHMKSPKGTIYEEHILLDGEYSPKLDFAIDALRGTILKDNSNSKVGISSNVNIALIGPSGIREFDDYENFPDAWIKDDPDDILGSKRYGFPKAMVDFKEQSKRRVMEATTVEYANLIYRVVLSGLKEIMDRFTQYQIVSSEFFTRDWNKDQIKRELLLGGAPRELLSRKDLEKRLELVDQVMRPILQS